MAETKVIGFAMPEIAEILVKKQDIHEGYWGIFVKFGIGAANVPQKASADATPSEIPSILPAAIVPILELGIQRFDSPNSLTVDAAKINPIPKKKRGSSKKGGRGS